jgi:hypothetical protein
MFTKLVRWYNWCAGTPEIIKEAVRMNSLYRAASYIVQRYFPYLYVVNCESIRASWPAENLNIQASSV